LKGGHKYEAAEERKKCFFHGFGFWLQRYDFFRTFAKKSKITMKKTLFVTALLALCQNCNGTGTR